LHENLSVGKHVFLMRCLIVDWQVSMPDGIDTAWLKSPQRSGHLVWQTCLHVSMLADFPIIALVQQKKIACSIT